MYSQNEKKPQSISTLNNVGDKKTAAHWATVKNNMLVVIIA